MKERIQKKHSQGVALITVMLVVALATIAAIGMASRQQFDIRRTENLLRLDQAYLHVLGIESWALGVLTQDGNNSEIDTLDEEWNTGLLPVEVEGGTVAGQIEDLQGRFNLNTLTVNGTVNAESLTRFRRLLNRLEIDSSIAYTVLDWVDSDLQPRFPNGAEDDEYSRMEPPYRTANAAFAHLSELRLVKGVSSQVYEQLAPFVATLPSDAPLNINTAKKVLLLTLAEEMTEAEADALVTSREEEPFQSVELFLKHSALAGREGNTSGLSVTSTHFLLQGEVRMGHTRVRLASTIERSGETGTRVKQRLWGGYDGG